MFTGLKKLCLYRRPAGKAGAGVTLRGWLYNKRSSGKVRFLLLRDGTGLVQGVMVKGKIPEADFAALTI